MVAVLMNNSNVDDLSSLRLTPHEPHLFLVVEGDDPAAGGARYSLRDVHEVIIGHGPERRAQREVSNGHARLSLRIPGSFIAPKHSRIVRRGGRWWLEDGGSEGGTLLNGARVELAALVDGDVIDVAHKRLLLRTALPTPQDAPYDAVSTRQSAPLSSTLLPSLAVDLAELAQVSRSKLSVVLVGETGTGKEVFARAIHQASNRPGRFTAVNCAALPPNLVESQLFGHVRGAFSGAIRDEPGFIRDADKGTLLLDEVSDLPKPAQATLLRVLQEGEVVPVGSSRPIKVDVRFIATTQEPFDRLVEAGLFRRDLRARLEGFIATLPSVRNRREDLGVLLAALWEKLRSSDTDELAITPDAIRCLFAYDWPLNIRELEQCLARGLALANGGPIGLRHLPHQVAAVARTPRLSGSFVAWEDDVALRKDLVANLEKHHGNITHVARAMGRARMQVHRWMSRLQIDPEEFRKVR